MKTFVLNPSLLLALVLGLAVVGETSFAGWSSNGADFVRDQNNPWFLGAATVNYCLHMDSSYKLPEREVLSLVRESLDEWKQFFGKYGLDHTHIGDGTYRLRFLDGQSRPLSLNFSQVPNCKAEQGDLEIFFGQKNAIIKNSIEQGGHHGAGLAVRSDFNHSTYRNGGFIWIENFSNERSKVKHMLLHELGHMFGMKHNSVHVMDEDIAHWMFDPKFAGKFVGQIESDYWKYNLDANESLQLFVSPSKSLPAIGASGLVSTSQIPASIRQLLKVSANGQYSAKIHFLRFAAPINSFFYRLEIAVQGENPQNITLQMQAIKDQNYDRYSPGIYTKWTDNQGRTGFAEQYIDLNRQPRSLIGNASMGAQSLAATLSLEKGVSLKIFEPTQIKWWELE